MKHIYKTLLALIVLLGIYNDIACSDSMEILLGTYLGNHLRNNVSEEPAPRNPQIIWKLYVGGGKTTVWKDTTQWFGTGWTGQPVFYRENADTYLIIGAYDHNLRKVNIKDGREIWQYDFGNVIKGTAALMAIDDSLIILQGSRRSFGRQFTARIIPSFRAVSTDGEEIWRMNIPLTDSYSRDIDGTPLIMSSRIYLGAENGYLYKINPFKTEIRDGIRQPVIDYSVRLYDNEDISAHQWNLVTESSPAYMDSTIYITSGSGHIYGIDINTGKKVFDFKTGSDMDGSPVITGDMKLVCPIEKQYIPGPGGIIKLDTKMEEEKSVIWYFPTESSIVPGWEGGVIGSPAVYERGPERDHLCAFMSVDGYLYVVALNRTIPDSTVIGFDSLNYYPTPELVYKKYIGGSISTPVFTDDYLIAGGYDCRISMFKINGMEIEELSSINLGGGIESTPAVLNGRIYVGCRNGYIYCIGDK